jgi:hypothetical protein
MGFSVPDKINIESTLLNCFSISIKNFGSGIVLTELLLFGEPIITLVEPFS